VIHVSATPALVGRVVVRVIARTRVCHHHHHTGVIIIADFAPVQPLTITICKVHGLASHFLAFATTASIVPGLI
jgi:hypothetical protein